MKQEIIHIKSLQEYHRMVGMSNLKHPLIQILDYQSIPKIEIEDTLKFTLNFYTISLKKNYECKSDYGQTKYDFDEGLMGFTSPNQVSSIDGNFVMPNAGWLIMVHQDFFLSYPLAQKIKTYAYFQYAVNEALILSKEEEQSIDALFQNIENEYNRPIDIFSQDVLISQLDLLLTFCNRFYQRQFITRKVVNSDLLVKFEKLLDDCLANGTLINKGLPEVSWFAEQLNLSKKYLSDVLKNLTGQSTQQHIHNKLIEKAKEKLSTTELSVNKIAYDLGFQHPQSFNKLFKSKTSMSPLEFRSNFN